MDLSFRRHSMRCRFSSFKVAVLSSIQFFKDAVIAPAGQSSKGIDDRVISP